MVEDFPSDGTLSAKQAWMRRVSFATYPQGASPAAQQKWFDAHLALAREVAKAQADLASPALAREVASQGYLANNRIPSAVDALVNCNVSDVTLTEWPLNVLNLSNTTFSNATFLGGAIDLISQTPDVEKNHSTHTTFTECALREVKFCNDRRSQNRRIECVFNDCSLHDIAIFRRDSRIEVTLHECRFERSTVTDFSGQSLRFGSKTADFHLSGLTLRGCDLYIWKTSHEAEATISGATMDSCQPHMSIVSTKTGGFSLQACRLIGCELSNLNIRNLTGSSLVGCKMFGTRVASVMDTIFSGCLISDWSALPTGVDRWDEGTILIAP